MFDNIRGSIEIVIQDRIEKIEGEKLATDIEYQQCQNKTIEIFKKLYEVLPDDQLKLVFQLEKLYSSQETLSQCISYKEGFKDGINIKEPMTLINFK